MKQIVIALNSLWFYFPDEKNRRELHGTPADCERKLAQLIKEDVFYDGIELYLEPLKLNKNLFFSQDFIAKFRKLKFRSIHIGSIEIDFLYQQERTYEKFKLLQKIFSQLDTFNLVVHAHHLKSNREEIRKLFDATLPGINIAVENNGFDSRFGSSAEDLNDIFSFFSEEKYKFCLDICHCKDWEDKPIDSFFAKDELRKRIDEVHFSFSTYLDDFPQEECKRFDGEAPYHALWSYINKKISKTTMDLITRYPLVIEGCVPNDDKRLYFLKKEIDMLRR